MDVSLKVPNYTTLSRHQSKLVEIPSFIQSESRHVVDYIGIKIYAEGEWKVHLRQILKIPVSIKAIL